MGMTDFSMALLDKHRGEAKTVIELGAQNIYHWEGATPYADTYYKSRGFEQYTCIDLNGENNALKIDLSKPIKHKTQYDLVTDFGTSEHIESKSKHNVTAFYNCLKTKHNLCRNGGMIVSENPKTGNWIGHGYNYYTEEFYTELAKANSYEIKELGEHPAMGNSTDGWNIFCVLVKVNSKPFMTLANFKKLPINTK